MTTYLTCCVCGQGAGRWTQHHNRDTGYGICPACVASQAATETPEDMQSLYGRPGINHDIPMTRHMGRRFRLLARARTLAQANAFMVRTPGAAVLLVADNGVFIVHQEDAGEPVTP